MSDEAKEGRDGFLACAESRLRSHEPRRFPEERIPSFFRRASVLVPLWRDGGAVRMLLTRRSAGLPSHQGEIAFPGGGREPGESAREASLREAHEEVGIRRSSVRIVGELNHVWSIGGYVVSPFVGVLDGPPRLDPDPSEISELIEAPVDALMDAKIHRVEPVAFGGGEWPVHYYEYGSHVIWGLTGGLLHQLFSLVREGRIVTRANDLESFETFLRIHGEGLTR